MGSGTAQTQARAGYPEPQPGSGPQGPEDFRKAFSLGARLGVFGRSASSAEPGSGAVTPRPTPKPRQRTSRNLDAAPGLRPTTSYSGPQAQPARISRATTASQEVSSARPPRPRQRPVKVLAQPSDCSSLDGQGRHSAPSESRENWERALEKKLFEGDAGEAQKGAVSKKKKKKKRAEGEKAGSGAKGSSRKEGVGKGIEGKVGRSLTATPGATSVKKKASSKRRNSSVPASPSADSGLTGGDMRGVGGRSSRSKEGVSMPMPMKEAAAKVPVEGAEKGLVKRGIDLVSGYRSRSLSVPPAEDHSMNDVVPGVLTELQPGRLKGGSARESEEREWKAKGPVSITLQALKEHQTHLDPVHPTIALMPNSSSTSSESLSSPEGGAPILFLKSDTSSCDALSHIESSCSSSSDRLHATSSDTPSSPLAYLSKSSSPSGKGPGREASTGSGGGHGIAQPNVVGNGSWLSQEQVRNVGGTSPRRLVRIVSTPVTGAGWPAEWEKKSDLHGRRVALEDQSMKPLPRGSLGAPLPSVEKRKALTRILTTMPSSRGSLGLATLGGDCHQGGSQPGNRSPFPPRDQNRIQDLNADWEAPARPARNSSTGYKSEPLGQSVPQGESTSAKGQGAVKRSSSQESLSSTNGLDAHMDGSLELSLSACAAEASKEQFSDAVFEAQLHLAEEHIKASLPPPKWKTAMKGLFVGRKKVQWANLGSKWAAAAKAVGPKPWRNAFVLWRKKGQPQADVPEPGPEPAGTQAKAKTPGLKGPKAPSRSVEKGNNEMKESLPKSRTGGAASEANLGKQPTSCMDTDSDVEADSCRAGTCQLEKAQAGDSDSESDLEEVQDARGSKKE